RGQRVAAVRGGRADPAGAAQPEAAHRHRAGPGRADRGAGGADREPGRRLLPAVPGGHGDLRHRRRGRVLRRPCHRAERGQVSSLFFLIAYVGIMIPVIAAGVGVAETSILATFIVVGAVLAAFDLAALAYLRRRPDESSPPPEQRRGASGGVRRRGRGRRRSPGGRRSAGTMNCRWWR